jgi:myo-inositol-1(or 4)-monophosphatase
MEASAAAPDWLAACRRIVVELRAMLDGHPSTSERAVELGRGEGGDQTLMIDAAAEELIFAELAALHAAGHSFVAISEERGTVRFDGPQPAGAGAAGGLRVVVDPIDGSLNAKRRLSPYTVSIAVADGPTMADVSFGFVYDFGSAEEWTGERGRGALLNEVALSVDGSERRNANGLLELVAIEMAWPRALAASTPALAAAAHRLRTFGSIAFSLCQLAGGRLDGVATLSRARSVDTAAAQLIVRESGGHVAFTACEDPLAASLEMTDRSPVIAARTQAALAQLRGVPSSQA